jgi:cell wall-associated NlpC family hydrolase
MDEAKDFSDMIGVPYKDGGRDLTGFDCYGSTIEAARRHGKILRDVKYTSHAPELADEYAPTMNVVKIDAPEKDAVIEMNYKGSLHIGFCLDEKTFLHSTKNQGVRISRIGSIPVKNFYRIV